ncbi:MAG: hypothetical protein D6767_01490 [Candidatus Hydrogenedentota bacterium]|nr:MAG: hypothetical protein D6767_01490 [Candidatus Hydrogenedentota bacterium]
MKEIEISKVIHLAEGNKYEKSCATFDLVDHIYKVDMPKSLRGRKPAVQAMTLLAEGIIKYGYEDSSEKSSSEEE